MVPRDGHDLQEFVAAQELHGVHHVFLLFFSNLTE
jgi:hypothetical protein